MIQPPLLALLQQFQHCFFSCSELEYLPILFLLSHPAFGLQLQQLLIDYSILFIQVIMVISLLQQSFSLSFKVLLCHFGFFSHCLFFPVEMLFWNLGIFFKLFLILELGLGDLLLDIVVATSSQAFQLFLDSGPFDFMMMPFEGEFFSQAPAGF